MKLQAHLINRIRHDGPISVADYMAECLLHPTLGYYSTRDPFGAQGDFITAPEISQMFGELIGLSLAQAWMDQGCPAAFTLAEFGPGRGTLMSDMLRATRRVPGFHDAARLCLLEASPALRKFQADTLDQYDPVWIETAADLPEQPLYLVANEFFDALPIRQFIREGKGWRERLIGEAEGALAFGLGPNTPQVALNDRLGDTADGDLVESCAVAIPIVTMITHRIASHGGSALIIDYGDWRSLGDTLQAVKAHEQTTLLGDPGQSDLTAHVDFEPLAIAARAVECAHTRLTPQGVFLERLGITARAQALSKTLNVAGQKQIADAHRRLTHPDEMGNLFKVLGLYPAHSVPPPGLEP